MTEQRVEYCALSVDLLTRIRWVVALGIRSSLNV